METLKVKGNMQSQFVLESLYKSKWLQRSLYYTAGIREAEYFVKFAESFLYPLQPLYTEQQINEFTSNTDVSTHVQGGRKFHIFNFIIWSFGQPQATHKLLFICPRSKDLRKVSPYLCCTSMSFGNDLLQYLSIWIILWLIYLPADITVHLCTSLMFFQNTVIGYFDFNSSPQPPGLDFHQFYLAALRTLSYGMLLPFYS